MKEDNNIDKFFKSNLEQGEAEAPQASWNAIQGKIKTDNEAGIFSYLNVNTNYALLLCLLFSAIMCGTGFYAYHLREQNKLLVKLLDKDEQLILKEEALYRELKNKNDKPESTVNNFKSEVNQIFEKPKNAIADDNANSDSKKSSGSKTENKNKSKFKTTKTYKPTKINLNQTQFANLDKMPTSQIVKSSGSTNLKAQREKKSVPQTGQATLVKSNVTLNGVEGLTKSNVVLEGASEPDSREESDNFNKINKSKNELVSYHNSAVKEAIHSSITNEISNAIDESVIVNLDTNSELEVNIEKKSKISSISDQADNIHTADTSLEEGYAKSAYAFPKTSYTQKRDSVPSKIDSLPQDKIAEESTTKKIKNKKAFTFANSIEFFVSPEVSYRSVSYSSTPLSATAKAYKDKDENKFAYSGGLLFNRKITEKLYVQTGILYSNFGDQNNSTFALKSYDTSYTKKLVSGEVTSAGNNGVDTAPAFSEQSFTKISENQTFDSKNAPIVTQSWAYNEDKEVLYNLQIKESVKNVAMHIKNSINYLGVPIVIGTTVGTSHWRFGAFSGVIANVLLSPSKVTAYSYAEMRSSGQEVVSRNIDLNRLNYVYWGGIDLTYSINEQWSFRIAPTVKHFMNSIYKDSEVVNQKPYSYGVQVGLKYNFVQVVK